MKTINGLTLFTFVLLLLWSCTKKEEEVPKDDEKDTFVVIEHDMNSLETNDEFQYSNLNGGPIASTQLVEASGLAVGRENSTILWSHNDSGHPNRIFAVGNKAEDFGYYTITGAGTRDYEDICIGAGPEEGVNYIYLADIGDNHAQYNFIIIYRFPEPKNVPTEGSGMYAIPEDQIERLEFTYPDGPRDAETLMIDPWTKDLYIVSKRDYRSIVYRAPYPQKTNERTTLEKLAQLPFNWAVGGDISTDGKQIAIKDRYKIYYWERTQNESVIEALTKKPQLLPYIIEPQGESFAWTADGNGYYTLTEKSGNQIPVLNYYTR